MINSPADDGAGRALSRKITPSWREGIALGAAAVVLVFFRLHAFDLPLETDECNYAYIGSRLLEGERLYVDVWDHQPFGVFALFAGAIALFGDAPEVFRWMAVGFSLASLGLVYAIVRRLSTPGAAVMAAFMFALVSSDPQTAGEGCNREIYMNTCILSAWYLALRSGGKPGWTTFAAGGALAIGSSIKTIVAIHWVFLGLWIAGMAWKNAPPKARPHTLGATIICFAAGPAILWLAAGGYYAATDRFHEFVDAVLLFNLSYSGGAEGFFARFGRFFAPPRHPFIFDSALRLWLGSIGGVAWLIGDVMMRRSSAAIAALSLILASYLAICMPMQFWPHYYYLLIPGLVIVLALAVGQLVGWLSGPSRGRRGVVRRGAFVLYGVFPALLLVTEYRGYLSQPPFGITVKRYNSRDFWGRAHGENVRRVTDPEDEVFVFGSDTAIYYYSQRRCASRFTMITGLRGDYAGAEQRRSTLIRELEADPPRLILVLFDEPPFEEWTSFLRQHYGEPIGWDLHDRTREAIMFVLARRDHPVEQINWDWDRAEVGGWNLGDRPPPSAGP